MNGFETPAGGAGVPGAVASSLPEGNFVVSFFGAIPAGGMVGLPGTLIRTVSRFTAGCSLFGGKVIRMVSLLVMSSPDSDGAGGFSSAISRVCPSRISRTVGKCQ
jgi:hypothetical protein